MIKTKRAFDLPKALYKYEVNMEDSVKTVANTTFEISIGSHKYLFVCDSGAEISEVYYALTTIRTKIFELIKKNEEFLEKEQTHPNVTEKEPETIV